MKKPVWQTNELSNSFLKSAGTLGNKFMLQQMPFGARSHGLCCAEAEFEPSDLQHRFGKGAMHVHDIVFYLSSAWYN